MKLFDKKVKTDYKSKTKHKSKESGSVDLDMLKLLSIITVVGTFVFIFYFFTSDVPDKILLSRSTRDVAVASTVEKMHTKESSNTPNVINEKGDLVEVDRKELVAYLKTIDDEKFDELVKSIIPSYKSGKDVSDAKESEASSKPDSSLEDAYAKASEKYPGKIDVSKRIKLVNELNNLGYRYYIAEKGDTLIALSRSFEVPIGQLVEINGIKDADLLPEGMLVLVPEIERED